jgi:hypothetical protein
MFVPSRKLMGIASSQIKMTFQVTVVTKKQPIQIDGSESMMAFA